MKGIVNCHLGAPPIPIPDHQWGDLAPPPKKKTSNNQPGFETFKASLHKKKRTTPSIGGPFWGIAAILSAKELTGCAELTRWRNFLVSKFALGNFTKINHHINGFGRGKLKSPQKILAVWGYMSNFKGYRRYRYRYIICIYIYISI